MNKGCRSHDQVKKNISQPAKVLAEINDTWNGWWTTKALIIILFLITSYRVDYNTYVLGCLFFFPTTLDKGHQ